MGFKLNLTKDDIAGAQGTYQALPEGIYGAVVYEAKFKTSKANNPMYELNFKITDGPAGIGRKQLSWFTLTPKALFKVIELNKAVGFPYPKSKDDAGEFEFADADEYLQEKVNLKIVKEPYPGVDDEGNDVTLYRNNVKNVYKYDEAKHTSEDELDEDGETSSDKGGLFL